MSDYKQLLEELPCPCCGLKKTELARLKELNREMVEVLGDLLWHVDGYDQFKDPVYKVLAEIEKEVQGE